MGSTVALAVIVAAAVWLRFAGLGAVGLWLDEVWSVSLAQSGFAAIVEAMRSDPHPPLHVLLLALVLCVPVAPEVAARALSALAGVATVLLAQQARPGGAGLNVGTVLPEYVHTVVCSSV